MTRSTLSKAFRNTLDVNAAYALDPSLRRRPTISERLAKALEEEGLAVLDYEHPEREHQLVTLPLAALERIVERLSQ